MTTKHAEGALLRTTIRPTTGFSVQAPCRRVRTRGRLGVSDAEMQMLAVRSGLVVGQSIQEVRTSATLPLDRPLFKCIGFFGGSNKSPPVRNQWTFGFRTKEHQPRINALQLGWHNSLIVMSSLSHLLHHSIKLYPTVQPFRCVYFRRFHS